MKRTKTKTPRIGIGFNLPTGLKRKLQKLAKKDNRKLAAFVRIVLERTVAQGGAR